MRVTIEPINAPRIDAVKLTADPVYRTQMPGGHSTATVQCMLPCVPSTVKDAAVTITPTRGRSWVGLIDTVDTDAQGVTTLECVGAQSLLHRLKPRAAMYCDTSTSEWRERTYDGRNTKMTMIAEDTRLRVTMEADIAVGTKFNAFYRRIPTTSLCVVAFDWYRPSLSLRLTLHSGTSQENDNGSEVDAWVSRWSQAAGSGDASGSALVTINPGSTFDSLALTLDAPSGYTPSVDTAVRFSNIRVYGVVATNPMTISTVLTDVLGRLPSWVCNPTDAFLWGDTSQIEPFSLTDGSTTEGDICEELLKYTSYDFEFCTRIVNGKDSVVMRYAPRPTTPRYSAYVDGIRVVADYAGETTEHSLSGVRVGHNKPSGEPAYYDATQSTEYRDRWAYVSADTTSLTAAQRVGAIALDDTKPIGGSVQVHAPIKDSLGGAVFPTEILAGELITLYDTQRGAVTGRIASVECSGDTSAVLELDATPDRLDIALARLQKRVRRVALRGGTR